MAARHDPRDLVAVLPRAVTAVAAIGAGLLVLAVATATTWLQRLFRRLRMS